MREDKLQSYDFLSYKGDVNLKIKIGDREVTINTHNSGKPNLFRTISRALCGQNVTSEVPYYMDIKMGYGSNGQYVSVLTKKSKISAKSYLYSNKYEGWISRFTALINWVNIMLYDASTTCKVYLEDINENELASITIDNTILTNAKEANSLLLIEWSLIVKNTEDGDEEDVTEENEQIVKE